MALIKCPKHRIPYNDDNPRGCPACAQEKGGGGNVMQELARASQMIRRPTGTGFAGDFANPVSTPPRVPVPTTDWVATILRLARNKRLVSVGGTAIAVLATVLFVTSRPRFSAAESPPIYNGVVRPFPVNPNDPIGMVFAALGPQTGVPNPTSRSLERYSYGTDLFVDGYNGSVYAITLAIPNRSWRGLRVGMAQTNAEGTLAALGTPREGELPSHPPADTVAGYLVYRSLDLRPRRTLMAQVRPPNGCYDVMVDLQPRALGVVSQRSQKWVAVVPPNVNQPWVITRIRVISRSLPGPYSVGPAC